jgi:hypothetical protein
MKKLWLGGFLALLLAGTAHAQFVPIPMQSSPAAGDTTGYHIFSGTTFTGAMLTWNAGTAARYFMIFDGGTPANGATTTCGTTQQVGCLALCYYLTESVVAPNRAPIDYTTHPIQVKNNVVEALSTGAGCGTLTLDTGTDWFSSQVKP